MEFGLQDAHGGAKSRKGRKQDRVDKEVAKAPASPVRSLVLTVCRPGVLLCARIPALGTKWGGHSQRTGQGGLGGLPFAAEADPEGAGGSGTVGCVHSPRPRQVLAQTAVRAAQVWAAPGFV